MYRINQVGKANSFYFINYDASYNEMFRAFRYVSPKWLPLKYLIVLVKKPIKKKEGKDKKFKKDSGKLEETSVIGDVSDSVLISKDGCQWWRILKRFIGNPNIHREDANKVTDETIERLGNRPDKRHRAFLYAYYTIK